MAAFGLDPEHELFALQRELASAEYRPGHRLFCIYEGKPRVIATAPFRDRVVHHAVMNLIEPPLGRAFIFDSYACRSGNGVQAAVERYQRGARRYTYAMEAGRPTVLPVHRPRPAQGGVAALQRHINGPSDAQPLGAYH